MSKTIKEVAEELNISKTAVRKYFSDEFRSEYITADSDGRIMISDSGVEVIREKLTYRAQTKAETTTNKVKPTKNQDQKPTETIENKIENESQTIANQVVKPVETTENTALSQMLEFLQKQLEEKDRQLAEKDKQLAAKDEQITNLTAAVENATNSTQAAQALAAADKKLLLEATSESKKSWWPWSKKNRKAAAENFVDIQEN